MDIDKLKKTLRDLQGLPEKQEYDGAIPFRPESQMEELPEVVEESVKAVELSDINKEVKSPYQKNKTELVEDKVDEIKDSTIKGQLEERTDEPVVADPSMRERMLANINRLEKEVNTPRKSISFMEALPDILAGAHNIINYGQGTNLPTLGTDFAKKLDKSRKEGKATEISQLQKLQDEYRNYLKSEQGGGEGKIFQTRSGLVRLDKDGNPQEIYKDPYMVSGSKVREDSLKLRQGKFDESKLQKYQDDIEKTVKLTRATDSWKTAEKSLSNIPNIELLLEDAYKEGGQSLSMLGPKIAKGIAGEVGVLTEQDVTRYVKNPQLVEGMLDSLSKIKDGQLTKASYDNIKRLLDISKQAAEGKMQGAIMRDAQLFAKREDIPLDRAYELLNNNFRTDKDGVDKIKKESNESKKDSKSFSQNQERGIASFMNRNNITREQAIKVLKKTGRL